MKSNGILFIILGILTATGGSIGFFIKGSLPSLIAGLSFGPLLILSGLQTKNGIIKFETLGLVITLALDLFFTYRLFKTHAIFPAGAFVILSTAIIAIVCFNIKRRINKIPTE